MSSAPSIGAQYHEAKKKVILATAATTTTTITTTTTATATATATVTTTSATSTRILKQGNVQQTKRKMMKKSAVFWF